MAEQFSYRVNTAKSLCSTSAKVRQHVGDETCHYHGNGRGKQSIA